jgi:adenylate kinase
MMVVLLGPVAAGKGTQAEAIARDNGLLHLSTGDLFRRNMREGTELGEVAQGYMRRGELVPDEITVAVVGQALGAPNAASGVVFDGFPRTQAQAEALDRLLEERGLAVDRAVLIEVPEEVLVERVAGRWVCPTCGTPYHATDDPPRQPGICDKEGDALVQREDDKPEVFRARLREQLPPMEDVARYYDAQGKLATVDGQQPIEAVTAAIREVLADRRRA